MMLFALMFVIWAANQVRQPGRWNWLWSMTPPPAPAVAVDQNTDDHAPSTVEKTATEKTATEKTMVEKNAAGRGVFPTNSGFFPGVDVDYLRMVEDNKVFRHTGEGAWLNLIEVLHTNEQSALDAASIGDVTYTQLQQQPAQYRGQLVTVQGAALRCSPKKAIKNNLGIETLHQIVFLADGGSNQSILIYVLELPRQFPTGENLSEPIQVTGFFFKNQVVTDGNDLFISPTLLAKTFRRRTNLSGDQSVSPTTQAGLATQAGQATQAAANANLAGDSMTTADRKAPRVRLERAGVDESHFRRLTDGQPPNLDEQEILLKLLYHVRRFNLEQLDRWTQPTWDWSGVSNDLESYRGQLFALSGRAKQVTIETPPQEVVARYELDTYYLCRVEFSDPKRTAWVFTPRIPSAWDIE